MKLTIAWISALLLFVPIVFGEDLSVLIEIAIRQNPKIQAERKNWEATIAKYPQAIALPDPMVMYGFYAKSVETRVGPQRHRISISQTVPYPGMLKTAGKLVEKEVEVAQKKFEIVVRDVVADLKIAYHELAYLDQAIDLTGKNQQLLEHYLAIAATRYANETATLMDLIRAESQIAQLSFDLVLLQELKHVGMAKINALLDRPTETPIENTILFETEPPEISVSKLEILAIQNRQEIQITDLQIEKLNETATMVKLQNKPMINLNLMTIETRKSTMEVAGNGKNPWIVGFSFSLPWGKLHRNDSRIRSVALNRDHQIDSKKAIQNQTKAEVNRFYFQIKNSERLIELYQNTLIPQAERTIEAIDQTGNITELLEAQSIWLNFHLAWVRAIADHHQDSARLQRLIGKEIR